MPARTNPLDFGFRSKITLVRHILILVLAAGGAATASAAEKSAETFDCLIEARQSIDLRSSVDGVIDKLYVRRGDKVRKGQLVATLESGPERAALEVARSRASMVGEIRSAEAKVDLAKKKWLRAEELLRKNFVSVNARDEAQAEYELAIEQLRAATENQKLAKLDVTRAEEVLEQRSIRSPINGVVVDVLLRPGDLMSSNQKDPIMQLVEVDPLNVELVLPVSQFGKLKDGQRAVVLPEQPVGGRYAARVEIVDPVVDAASGTFGVRLRLPNPGYRIPAGIKCRVQF
jgi:RND family efflux transporter MFP subunit